MEAIKELPRFLRVRIQGEFLANAAGDTCTITSPAAQAEGFTLAFAPSRAVGVHTEEGSLYVLCPTQATPVVRCNGDVWVLPETDGGKKHGVCITGAGEKVLTLAPEGLTVHALGGECTLRAVADRPRCDVLGNGYSLGIAGGDEMEKTLANFYWDTLVPSVIEKTDALAYPEHEGYVVSTLQPGEYAGTYPDVDHEFQCKGRLALHGGVERDVVRRMMALQCKMMREDPVGLWRDPCAVQPDGTREYHVRRNSLDTSENAEMFLVTGNVEILETAWLYYAATRDRGWLAGAIADLEGAASLLELLTDEKGRLWSDVFYEDQVIKDGMECMSAALAANSLRLLGELEDVLGRTERAKRYEDLAQRLAAALARPQPLGFWDGEKGRFVDWVDRHGGVHDHIHLLANCLPVLFGFGSSAQRQAAEKTIEERFAEFQRFPSFVSPHIEEYTESEMGTAGPYDLCAAGRYWCWDAAYWGSLKRRDVLHGQLMQVAAQAALDGYRMGERYDMNHVYYKDTRNWHGAAYYYEYPNVFAWVLVHEYLGLRPAIDVNYELRPMLEGYGQVRLDAYGLAYRYEEARFVLENTGARALTLRAELGALYPGAVLTHAGKPCPAGQTVTLAPGEQMELERQG